MKTRPDAALRKHFETISKERKSMKICFPTQALQGIESIVFEHFGSAPGFVIVDTENMTAEEIGNNDQHHVHGMCQPTAALGGRMVDAVVVAGIGAGALSKLNSQGIRVFRSAGGTIAGNIDLFKNGKLPEFEARFTCSGHAEGGGCSH